MGFYFTYDEDTIRPLFDRYQYLKGYADACIASLGEESRRVLHTIVLAEELQASLSLEEIQVSHSDALSAMSVRTGVPYYIHSPGKQADQIGIYADVLSDASTDYYCSAFMLRSWFRKTNNASCSYTDQETEDLSAFVREAYSEQSVIKAAVASYYVNRVFHLQRGRNFISRTIITKILSSEEKPLCFSVSNSLQERMKRYWSVLRRTKKDESGDLTLWVQFFIESICQNLQKTIDLCDSIAATRNSLVSEKLNSRQQLMISKMISFSLLPPMTKRTWMETTGCDSSTAQKDLTDLMKRKIIVRCWLNEKECCYLLSTLTKEVNSKKLEDSIKCLIYDNELWWNNLKMWLVMDIDLNRIKGYPCFHDCVEDTVAFKKAMAILRPEAKAKCMATFGKEGFDGSCHWYWAYYEIELESRFNICWYSKSICNPSILYD